MNAVIARKGKFTLRYKSWFGDKVPTTWDLEVCADCIDTKGVYAICCFVPSGDEWPDVKSIGNRMLDAIEQDEDIQDLKSLVRIACDIISQTDQIPLLIYT